MTQKKLGDISLDKLRKRKNISLVLLCVLLSVGIICIGVLIVNYTSGKPPDTGALAGVFSGLFICIFFSIFFYRGVRDINGEIRRRKIE